MKIKDMEIICPPHKPLIKKLESLSSMNIYQIHRYQQKPRHFPESNAGCEDYCLYLGSIEDEMKDTDGKDCVKKYDLWHYPYYANPYPSYSTAIIYGDALGSYLSGWPSLALKHKPYKALLHREIVCGLVTEPKVIMELGLAALDLRADMSQVQYNATINEAAGGTNSLTDYEGDDEFYFESDWWVQKWWQDDFKKRLNKGSN